MMRFTVFDRWGKQVGTLPEVIEAVHKDEVNGEDSLTLVMPSCSLVKGQRIVWRDKFFSWHEHIVNDVKTSHGDGQLLATVYCENSVSELLTDYIENLQPHNTSAFIALQKALSVTTWQVGVVDDLGVHSASFYHINPHEAIGLILESWGGEVSTTIEVTGTQVSARKVNITKRRGADNGKRFTWDKDIVSIEREVGLDDVCTALYGYGKGIEKTDEDDEWTGGYERKLTFGDINGGKDWVGDDTARLKWGLPDGKGGIKHTIGTVEYSDCEDKSELLRLTKAALREKSKPHVTYTANVLALADGGLEHEDAKSGDTVALIDKGIDERLQGRILCVERYLYNTQATVMTLGNVLRSITSVMSGQAADLNWIKNHASSWDGAASVSDNYINRVINNLNNTMNSTGGYTYYKPGEGTITYDKPENQNPTMAVQMVGGGIRIANSKMSNGDWNWRTFGTGDGFTADCLTAGIINGGANHWNLETGDLLFRTGGIYDSAGKNYWNLDTGEFQLSANANVGGSAAADLVVNPDVQYGLSDDANVQPTTWTTTALWQKGRHLWSRVKMTHADGSITYTTPRRIANDKGMGASEVAEQYYLSTSSTTQTGGAWYNNQPSWVKGRYYWTRSRITWSDGTVTYTTPQIARALTSANQSTNNLDDELTQHEIFRRLTNNGQTQGIYLSGGKLYINATYLNTGIISDQYGRNTWNLNTGALTTKYMNAQGATVDGTITTGASTSYQAKMTGGAVRFYYNSRETIELVSIPSYTDGSKGGYLQCCNGATYLGLRAPKLYTALNTSEAGTLGSTGSIWVAGFDYNPGSWNLEDLRLFQISFKNGICISGNVN